MKALTLWQPWATFVAHGLKTVETRSWDTRYRGWLAIHAAAQMPAVIVKACRGGRFAGWLEKLGYTVETLPRGVVVCKADLITTFQTTAECTVSSFEYQFGDYTPGRFGWAFGVIVRYVEPVKARGQMGLWDWIEPDGIRKGLVRRVQD